VFYAECSVAVSAKNVPRKHRTKNQRESGQLHVSESLRPVNKDFGALRAPIWDGNKPYRPFGQEKIGPCAQGGRITRNSVVLISIPLLENIHELGERLNHQPIVKLSPLLSDDHPAVRYIAAASMVKLDLKRSAASGEGR